MTLPFLLLFCLAACDEEGNPLRDGSVPDLSPDVGLADAAQGEGLTPDGSHDQGTMEASAPDQGAADAAGDKAATPDAGQPDQFFMDFVLPKTSLQAVANTLTLPTNASLTATYAYDLDGDGTKDNALGTILGTVAALGGTADLQKMINDDLKQGNLLYLLEVFGKSLVNEPKAIVQVHQGADTDGNASNNFSGSAKLTTSTASPKNALLSGPITNAALNAGPANVTMPLPLTVGSSLLVSMKLARVRGTLSGPSVSAGIINGAIPMSEINKKVVPGMASVLDHIYKDPNTDASTKSTLKLLFDTNSDGTITGAELLGNVLVKGFLVADVDTDGDKIKDSLSMGFGFTAVSCQIQ